VRPTPTPFVTLEQELVLRLIALQKRFDAGEWTGREALEYVRETRAIRRRLSDDLGLTELDIELAIHDANRDKTP
jgi:hypothetical protein